MKKLLPLLMFTLMIGSYAFAQDASPLPLPDVAPSPGVSVDPVFVPPTWLETAILFVKNIPGVGPVLVEIGKWVGVVGTILTALCVFLLSVLNALQKVFSASKLMGYVNLIQAFKDGKIMYWLKYFSFLNAKEKKEDVV